jgi:hypothetical protein
MAHNASIIALDLSAVGSSLFPLSEFVNEASLKRHFADEHLTDWFARAQAARCIGVNRALFQDLPKMLILCQQFGDECVQTIHLRPKKINFFRPGRYF